MKKITYRVSSPVTVVVVGMAGVGGRTLLKKISKVKKMKKVPVTYPRQPLSSLGGKNLFYLVNKS